MSTETATREWLQLSTGEPQLAHLVAPKDGMDGATRAFTARINGTFVECLCGHRLIPSRDPLSLPTCDACLAVLKQNTGADDASQCSVG